MPCSRLAPALAGLLASCGALFNGNQQMVHCSSDPAGARLLVDGLPSGTTPCRLSLTGDEDHNLEFQLDGYQPRVVTVQSGLEAGWLVLDIVPGFFVLFIIPIVVDASSGDWNGLSPDNVHVVLERR